MISVVAVLAVGATGAFFSDTETSSGNTFAAGAIDLTVDNTSYYNGVYNPETSWIQKDLESDNWFFNFLDLKPEDMGEDTISLHVANNDSYLCADVTLTSDNDNGVVEPEGEDGDTTPGDEFGVGEGELASAVNFIWWADDGDNVLEVGEDTLPGGPLGALGVGNTANVTLADSQTNIWGDANNILPANSIRYIGKAWCFGDIALTPVAQDGQGPVGTPGQNDSNGPDQRGAGFTCDGSGLNNITQTDSMTADISFRAIQSRNNTGFVCSQPEVIDLQPGDGEG